MFNLFRKKPAQTHNKPRTDWIKPTLDILPQKPHTSPENAHFDGDQIAAILSTVTPCKHVKTTYSAQITTYHFDLSNPFEISKIKRSIPGLQAVAHCHLELTDSTVAHFAIVAPNATPQTVHFQPIMRRIEHNNLIALLGVDMNGKPQYLNLSKAPHTLIAGQTGSGKSVLLNVLLSSLLVNYTPAQMQVIMIDPKQTELTKYNGIPHLVQPVITDAQGAIYALNFAVSEMERRYKIMSEKGLKDNDSLYFTNLVIVIDELADLMITSKNAIESNIVRLAQLGRAAGVHLLIATQRPTVNVITGLIKANIPTRIALNVASVRDSMTILDHKGAEKLLGNGDGLLKTAHGLTETRIQSAYIDDNTISAIVEYWIRQG